MSSGLTGASGCADVWHRAPDRDGYVDRDDLPDEGTRHGADRPPTASGRTFYVSEDGDDADSGRSAERAWRSLDRVNQQTFEPGDELLFERGSVFQGTLQLHVQGGGDPYEPVHVSAFGGRKSPATLDASDGSGIVIQDLSGVSIDRLRIVGGWNADDQAGNDGEGISIIGTQSGRPASYVRLRQLEVSGFKRAGIGLHARPDDDSKNSGYRDVAIDDCEVHDNADFGVLSDGPYIYDGPGYSHADVRVRSVLAHHNRGLRHKGEHTGSGIVLSDVDGALIERSVAHHNGEFNDHEGGGGFGIWAWDSNAVTIQYNESYDNRTQTADGGGFDLDGGVTRSVLRYNYSHGNQGAGYGAFQFAYARAFHENRIYENISQNDGYAFLVWDGNGDMGSLAVLQNVGYGATPSLVTFSAVSDVSFLNNIFYSVGSLLADVFAGDGLRMQGNVYFSADRAFALRWGSGTDTPLTFDSFESFQDVTGQETHAGTSTGSARDPELVAPGTGPTLDDPEQLHTLTMYKLQRTSPLRDAGVDPRDFDIQPVRRDFFGGPVPEGAGFDPGVHERR